MSVWLTACPPLSCPAPCFMDSRARLFRRPGVHFSRERHGFALVLDAGAGFVYEVIFT